METMRRIGYGKFGRSVLLDPAKWGPVGGDNEPYYLLRELATRHPDVTWVLTGRHSGHRPENVGLPPNVEVPELPKLNDWEEAADREVEIFLGLDGVVLWAGQHGTTNTPIPSVEDRDVVTKPQDSFKRYCAPHVRGLNAWRDVDPAREEVWLCADPRNYLKARDIKWPPHYPILGQFNWDREQKHERYGDDEPPGVYGFDGGWVPGPGGELRRDVWLNPHRYVYSGLEITGIPLDDFTPHHAYEERAHFGILINEARPYVGMNRRDIMAEWVMPLNPAFIHGKWTPKSADMLGISPEPIPHNTIPERLSLARSTFTTPSSGSRWATTKPWECFALDVVCFFHPEYDAQNNILRNAGVELSEWLRPKCARDLWARVQAVNESRETYEWLVVEQRKVLHAAFTDQLCVRMIEQRLGLA